MTKLEREMVQDLCRCAFAPGTPEKRFIRQLAGRYDTNQHRSKALSERQRIWLAKLHYKYRKQITDYCTANDIRGRILEAGR